MYIKKETKSDEGIEKREMLLQRLFDKGVNNATVSKEGFLFAKKEAHPQSQ